MNYCASTGRSRAFSIQIVLLIINGKQLLMIFRSNGTCYFTLRRCERSLKCAQQGPPKRHNANLDRSTTRSICKLLTYINTLQVTLVSCSNQTLVRLKKVQHQALKDQNNQ